ncbi:MAG: polyprenyl synthetase family protein [Gemmatimonadetes bacterium]|nr:polyprenyl synthetase family protein [Gemmatimonadota bacterium]
MTDAELVREALGRRAAAAARIGISVPPAKGQLLRPLAALSFVSAEKRDALDERFWFGCLAIQMAHEASLQHDDMLDGGRGRRNAATLLAREGPGAALLRGDLYLTGSYRAARMAGSEGFLDDFIRAVESTVQGERMQAEIEAAADLGAAYEVVVRAKSGSLFGAATALPGWTGDSVRDGAGSLSPEALREVGIELGAFYQLVDDFLDYCPAADTGKPKLLDFGNRTWTSVLGARGRGWFDRTPDEAATEFFRAGSGRRSMADQAMERLEERGAALLERLRRAGAGRELIGIVGGWIDRCDGASRSGGGAGAVAGRPRGSANGTMARIASRA